MYDNVSQKCERSQLYRCTTEHPATSERPRIGCRGLSDVAGCSVVHLYSFALLRHKSLSLIPPRKIYFLEVSLLLKENIFFYSLSLSFLHIPRGSRKTQVLLCTGRVPGYIMHESGNLRRCCETYCDLESLDLNIHTHIHTQ